MNLTFAQISPFVADWRRLRLTDEDLQALESLISRNPLAGVLMVVLLVVLTFVAKRTTFGRHVYAVGGNAEAARRAARPST